MTSDNETIEILRSRLREESGEVTRVLGLVDAQRRYVDDLRRELAKHVFTVAQGAIGARYICGLCSQVNHHAEDCLLAMTRVLL